MLGRGQSMTYKLTDKKSIRLLAILGWMIYFSSYITRLNFGAILVEFIQSEGIMKSAASAITTALFITYGAGQLVSGFLGDRVSPRLLIFGGLLVASLCNIVMPLVSPSIPAMTVVWGINGMAQAMMWPPLVKICASALSSEDYNRLMPVIGTSCATATIAVYLVSPLIISISGWQQVFYVAAVIATMASFVWFVLTRPLLKNISFAPAVLEEKREKVEAELHRIVSGIDARMSAAEKALSVHDWFALHYQYNMPAAQKGVLCEAHRVDGLFIDKTAVCQGYALGFLYVMQELGIPCRYIASESMGHAWNLVQIDGAWYHVDVTYDDPLYTADDSDMFGYVSHESFLRGNAGIRESAHEGWELPSDIREVSEEDFGGENPFWKNMKTGAHYLDGKWYYKKGDSIVKRGFSETEEETVKSISERWPYREGFFYSQTFFDIGIYDGRIYYNTPRDVRSIKPDGTDERILFSPVLSEDTEIYKILILEDTVYIGTAEEYTLVPERQEGMRLTDKISFVTEVKDGQLIITMTGRTDRDGIFALSAKADRRQEAFTCAPLIHGHELFKIDIPDTTQKEITFYVWDGLVPLVEPLTIFLEES